MNVPIEGVATFQEGPFLDLASDLKGTWSKASEDYKSGWVGSYERK